MQKFLNYILQISIRLFFKPILKESQDPDLKKVVKLYQKDGFAALFAKIRIWDTPFEDVEILIPKKGLILDLGCGDGIFTNYLALKSKNRKIIGVELNKQRIEDAKKGFKNTKFILADVLNLELPKVDVILMYHLLHHLPSKKDQEILIEKCGKALKDKGKMVIIEVDKKPVLKYLFAHLTDKIIVPILFDNRFFDFNINYRSGNDWVKLLKKYNFRVEVFKADAGKPYSHIILNCLK